jgi:hypothetical protein
MRLQAHARAATLLAGALLATAAGCLVVTPLDDVPGAEAGAAQGGSKAGANQGGGSSALSGVGGATEPGEAGSAGEPVSDGHCETNLECSKRNADAPARCRPSDHTCVPLKSDECPVIIGKDKHANALYLGAFATLDRVTPADNAIVWAHQLAINELDSDNVGGLPDGPDGPDGTRRPLVMIVCNNLPDTVELAMKHLAEDVQAPAVIATLKPGDLLRAFETYKKRDIFYLSPVAVTTSVIAEPDDGHIWNLLGQPSDLAPTYVEVLKLSEAHLRKLYDIQQPAALKVALVTTSDAYDDELANSLRSVLQFNGKSISANGANFKDFTIPTKPNFVALAKSIGEFGPDIVISAASEGFVMNGGLQDEVEADWVQNAGAKRRPFYILSPFNAGDLSDLLGRVSGQLERTPGVQEQQRYVGVSIASALDNTLQNAYEVRLSSVTPDPVNDTANYYDAVYYLAYAMYAANQPDGITGSGITAGMQRLLQGSDVNIGPIPISSTFKTLANQKSTVHLVSTLGPPDFDATSGVRPVDGSVFCIDRTGNTAKPLFDALRYDKAKKVLTGDALPCISGFFMP